MPTRIYNIRTENSSTGRIRNNELYIMSSELRERWHCTGRATAAVRRVRLRARRTAIEAGGTVTTMIWGGKDYLGEY